MPRELRKRKEAPSYAEVDEVPVKKRAPKKGPVAKAVAKVQEVAEDVKEAIEDAIASEPAAKGKTNGKSKVAVGSTVDLESFGGEVETHDGEKTTLKKLVDESKGGVVLFTYPKASTGGCKCSHQHHS